MILYGCLLYMTTKQNKNDGEGIMKKKSYYIYFLDEMLRIAVLLLFPVSIKYGYEAYYCIFIYSVFFFEKTLDKL